MSTKVLLRFISLAVLLSVSAFAVDGTVLINQATVMTAGGFPYKILQPGSYKLSGNLVATSGASAIEIDADNVVLDLNGFKITAVSGTGVVAGVDNGHFAVHPGLVVVNGAIDAVAGVNNFATTTVRNVSISARGGFGISITNGTVTDCTISVVSNSGFSLQPGIGISEGGMISGNTVAFFFTGISGNNLAVTNNLIENSSSLGLFEGSISSYGSNTFIGNAQDIEGGTSMKNNVCSNGSLC
jgi:hypothetical protein